VKGLKLDQIRWDSVAKIGAGVLLAVAIATSLPSLLDSEQPKPLEPDVGLPQVALPPPVPPVAPAAPRPNKPTKRPKRDRRPPKRPRKPKKPKYEDTVTAPTVTSSTPLVPSGSAEDFGFERP
jgi:outer membrane biosynthesis protein TonB